MRGQVRGGEGCACEDARLRCIAGAASTSSRLHCARRERVGALRRLNDGISMRARCVVRLRSIPAVYRVDDVAQSSTGVDLSRRAFFGTVRTERVAMAARTVQKSFSRDGGSKKVCGGVRERARRK